MEWFQEKYPERYEEIRQLENRILKQTFDEVWEELNGKA
jgi:hypothetical protein